MIYMAMRNENGVEMADLCPQSLLAKIDRRVNEYFLIAMLDQDRNSQAFVTRIVGQARLAVAADGRNACRCACAEERELHKRNLPQRTQRSLSQFLKNLCVLGG